MRDRCGIISAMPTKLDPARLAAVRASIDGPAAKARHAIKHFGSLRYQAANWLKGESYTTTDQFDTKKGWAIVRLKVLKEPPETLGLLAGDLVHDLRGALDHLVYQLARLTTDDPTGTQFPIFINRLQYIRKRDAKPSYRDAYLAGVPDEYRAFIDDLQPFNTSNPTQDRLAILQAFSNIDKHKLINSAYFTPTVDLILKPLNFSPSEFEVRYAPGGPVQDGAELFRFRPFGGFESYVNMGDLAVQMEHPLDIAWGPGMVTFTEFRAIFVYVLRIVTTLIAFVENGDGLPDPRHDVARLMDPNLGKWIRLPNAPSSGGT